MSISIVIPVHNAEKYLDECLQSALKQCTERDEIILVENGSSDNSPSLCKKYAQQYGNVRYIELGPVGVSAARNAGLLSATCEWVVFLDADDMLVQGALNVAGNIEDKEVDIIVAGYTRTKNECYELGNFREVPIELLQKAILNYARYSNRLHGFSTIDSYNNWACWGKFFKRDFLQKNQILFPVGITHGEDAAFCYLAYSYAGRVVTTNQIVYYYRVNSASVLYRYAPGLYQSNVGLIKCFENYKNIKKLSLSHLKCFNVFYTNKVIEICINCLLSKRNKMDYKSKVEIISNICDDPVISQAIKNAGYCKLVAGKRNSLRYAVCLFYLKHKKYDLLLRRGIRL